MAHLKTYEAGAKSGTPLLFIHGWTCDHAVMTPLAVRFKDHPCISVDLLGHGDSPRSNTDYSIYAQADAVEKTLHGRLSKMVVVGHSMGGQVALKLAARGVAQGAVLLDPAPILPHEKAIAWGEGMRKQLGKVNIPSMMAAFARDQFVGPVDAALADSLVETMQATRPDVVKAAWDAIMEFDGARALEVLQKPVLCVFADKPLNDTKAMAKASKNLETAQTAGSGHMQQLEVPDQLELMIRRFMALNAL